MPLIFIYITYPNMREAEKITSYLIKKRIVACANIFPVKNSCWWKGKIEKSKEIVSILKTKSENWEKVKFEVKKLHSYEIPCIIKMNAEANSDYELWVKSETR